jgi:hypothetical protein
MWKHFYIKNYAEPVLLGKQESLSLACCCDTASERHSHTTPTTGAKDINLHSLFGLELACLWPDNKKPNSGGARSALLGTTIHPDFK